MRSVYKQITVKVITIVTVLTLAIPVTLIPQPAKAFIPVIDATMVSLTTTFLSSIGISTTGTLVETIFQYAQESLLASMKKRILDMLVDQIIDYIQGGGKPKFVSNWKGFMEDAANQAIGDYVSGAFGKKLGIDFLCEPFNFQLKFAISGGIAGGPIRKFNGPAACTLDQITGNIESFYNDFKTGGFIAYSAAWDPENNMVGAYLTNQSAVINQIIKNQDLAAKEANAGGGFLSSKECIEDNGIGADIDGDGIDGDIESTCRVLTPGSTIGNLAAKAAGTDLDFIANADQLGEYVTAIANALISRITAEATGGLAGLSTRKSRKNGQSSGVDWAPVGTSSDACVGLSFEAMGEENFNSDDYDACVLYQDSLLGSISGARALLVQNVQDTLSVRVSAQQLLSPVKASAKKLASRLEKKNQPNKQADFNACLIREDVTYEYGTGTDGNQKRLDLIAYFDEAANEITTVLDKNRLIINGDPNAEAGSPLQYGLKAFLRKVKGAVTREELEEYKLIYETTSEFQASSGRTFRLANETGNSGGFKDQVDSDTDLYNSADPAGGLICLEKDTNGLCTKEPVGGLLYTISRLNDFLDKPCGPDKDSIDTSVEDEEETATP